MLSPGRPRRRGWRRGTKAGRPRPGSRAMGEARQSARWDRLAEVAEFLGDRSALADACRRIAEATTVGGGRNALWKRAGETAREAGRTLDAAEAFRLAGEPLLAGPLFLAADRPQDAARELERGGDLPGAAEALGSRRAGEGRGRADRPRPRGEGRLGGGGGRLGEGREVGEGRALLRTDGSAPGGRPRLPGVGQGRAGRRPVREGGEPRGGRLGLRGGRESRARGRHLRGPRRLGAGRLALPAPPGSSPRRRGSSRTRAGSTRRLPSSFAPAGASTRRETRSGRDTGRRRGTS
jgi:hypothetical protein